MYEQWHPLGVVGVISPFNFPGAVWSWNSALAAVCGDSTLWKPSSQTPLCAIACTRIAERVCRATGADPAIFSLVIGKGSTIGDRLLHDRRIPLISATGSCRMGYRVGEVVGKRLGRTILELGGNNAIIVTPEADMKLALRGIAFGSVGTAGQRCTSTRRIIVHESVRKELIEKLIAPAGRHRQPAGAQHAYGAAHRRAAVETTTAITHRRKAARSCTADRSWRARSTPAVAT
jgi:aldehyde dehydrogenase (NAD+)